MGEEATQCPTEAGQDLLSKGNNIEKTPRNYVYRANVLVPDSPHSWLVCAANFIIMTTLSANSRLMYMTVLDLVQKYDVTLTTVSLGFTFQLLTISLMSTFVTSLIVPYTGERIACTVFSSVGCLATYCIGISPNIAVFLIVMTIKGACTGIITVPSMALISKYFNRRKSLANALAASGVAVGSMAAPPLVDMMLQNYGLEMTYLLMAAIEMNSIWASMLLRPISRYRTILNVSIKLPCDDVDRAGSKPTTLFELPSLNGTDENVIQQTDIESDDRKETFANEDTGVKESDNVFSTRRYRLVMNEGNLNPLLLDETESNKLNSEKQVSFKKSDHFFNQRNNITEFNELGEKNEDETAFEIIKLDIKNSSSDKTDDDEYPVLATKEAAYPDRRGSHDDKIDKRSRITTVTVRVVMEVLHAFNVHLLRYWSMRLLLLYCTSASVIMYIQSYLPTIAYRSGMTIDEVSTLLVIQGACDLAGKIVIGSLADLKVLTAGQLVAISQIIMGTICHFAVYYTSFGTLMILAVTSGVLAGSRAGLAVVICHQFMGDKYLLKAFGVQTMLATLSMGVHHPLLNSILEATGSYGPPMHYVGVAAYISAIFAILQPIAKRLDVKARPSL